MMTALTSAATVIGWLSHRMSGLQDLITDWRGEPARPGVPARDGVMVRLEKIERKLSITEYNTRPSVSNYDAQMCVIKEILEEINSHDREPRDS